MADEQSGVQPEYDGNGVPAEFGAAMDTINQGIEAEAQAKEEAAPAPAIDEVTGEEIPAETAKETASTDASPAAPASTIAGMPTEALAAFIMSGWKDSEIQKVADAATAPKAPVAMAPAPAPVAPTVEQPISKVEELVKNLDPDIVGSDVKAVMDALIADRKELSAKVASLEGGVQSHQQQLQQEVATAYNTRIESAFDSLAKDIPSLGVGGKLTKEQTELRLDLHEHARLTAARKGMTIEKALELEVQKHKNMGGEKVATQKVLEKIKQQEKQFTNRPTRRTAEPARQFADDESRAKHEMQEAQQRAREMA